MKCKLVVVFPTWMSGQRPSPLNLVLFGIGIFTALRIKNVKISL